MASSNQPETKEPGGVSSFTPPPFVGGGPMLEIGWCIKGLGRTITYCDTCKGCITLSCRPLKHVARCEAINAIGKPCDYMFSTNFGCFKHPYRKGHNPEMRAHAHLVNGVDPCYEDPEKAIAVKAERERRVLAERALLPHRELIHVPWKAYTPPKDEEERLMRHSWPINMTAKKAE